MSNELTAFMNTRGSELALSDDQMADALENTVTETSSGAASGTTFLNFSGRNGRYKLGREQEDVDPEDIYLMEPHSIFTGWQCWKGGNVAEKVTWSIYRPDLAVKFENLNDHGPYNDKSGEGWKQMLGFGVLPTDDSGLNIEFSVSTISGRNAVGEVLDEIKARARKGEPTIPLIHFDREKFTAQEQTNWKPKLRVAAWVTREQAAAFFKSDVNYTLDNLLQGKKLTAAQQKKLAT